jgi:hypothetical protein
MKSFIKQLNKSFQLLESKQYDEPCECDTDDCDCRDNEVDEQNVTGAVAGFNTPAAFAKPGKWKQKSAQYESVNTPPTYKIGEYQIPEAEEEEYNDKFPFSTDDIKWQHKNYKYPSVNLSGTPGTASKKHKTLTVSEQLDKRYEALIESYRNFATGDSQLSPEQKVKSTIKDIAKRLHEIETIVNYNSRLKNESGIAASTYGSSTNKALAKISERLVKISERVRALGE